jgi:BNR/Asp-box repeat
MRRAVVVLSLALAAVVAGASTAYASALVQVSDPSPFAACTIGGGPAGVVNFPSAEVEPFMTSDPRRGDHLVGAWQQDRWNDGGAHGLVATVTFDGGRHFTNSTLPFSECAPGGLAYERASDPGVAVDASGRIVYSIGLPFDESTLRNGVGVARSLDGGRTWIDAQPLVADVGSAPNGNPFDDKELIFADPSRPGTAYAVWDRFVDVPGVAQPIVKNRSRPVPQAVQHARAAAAAQPVAQAAPGVLSMTHDGGRHWSPFKVIVPAAANEFSGANYVVVDHRRGTIYDFTDFATADNQDHLAFVRSTDGGETWSKLQFIRDENAIPANDPITGEHVREGAGLPIPAIDPGTGRLYVVWEDAGPSGGVLDQVFIVTSRDGGETWSAPKLVSTVTGRPAFTPTVAVAGDGTVGVTYYDYRNLPAGDTTTLPTDYWLKKAEPGELEFGPDIHVAGSFDMLVAPFVDTRGHFLGDYEGLAAAEGRFHPLFAKAGTDPSNRTDIFTGGF